MKLKHSIFLSVIFCILCSLNIGIALAKLPKTNKISFWNHPQRGANIFNQEVTREDIKAAKAYGYDDPIKLDR